MNAPVGVKLSTCVDLFIAAIQTNISALYGSERFEERLPFYLIFLHQIVRASVPLLHTAHMAFEGRPGSPVKDYLRHHINEERNHDLWLIEDMLEAGISESEIRAVTVPDKVAETVGAVYYWILHVDPHAVLGYIAAVESRPVPASIIRRWQAEARWPNSLFRTLLFHATEDEHHRADLYRLLDTIQLEPSTIELIRKVSVHTICGFGAAIKELSETLNNESLCAGDY